MAMIMLNLVYLIFAVGLFASTVFAVAPIINAFEDQEVNEGESVSISCSVEGTSKPDFIRITAPDGMMHELDTRFFNVGSSISTAGYFTITCDRYGNFTCSSGNEDGTTYAFADITIKDDTCDGGNHGSGNFGSKIGLDLYLALMMIAVFVWSCKFEELK